MPSALVENFINGSYTPRSTSIDDEACVNLFVETTRIAGAVKSRALIGTPGLIKDTARSIAALASGCRGMFTQGVIAAGLFTTQQTITYYAIGNTVYYSQNGGAGTALGNINGGTGPVTFASNGTTGGQIAVCDGSQIKIISGNSPGALSAAIVLPFAAPVQVGFLDGYFLALQDGTSTVWFSHLYNGTLWDALDFFARSHTADEVVGFVVVDSRIWTFGTENIELYYDVGDADNPFAPYPGSVLPFGAINYASIVIAGNAVVWLARLRAGTLCIMTARLGSAPEQISTPEIDIALAAVEVPDYIWADGYRDQSHDFVLFFFTAPSTLPPSGGDVWCVDLAEPEHPWHRRATGASSTTGWRASRFTVSSYPGQDIGAILCGDFANGNIYKLDLGAYTDNGTAIKRLRRAPYLSAENQWIFIDSIELGCETGVGNVADPDPQISLELSRDSGNTFDTALPVSMGAAGAVETVVSWQMLGRARADRLVIQVSSSAKVKQVWTPGLWLRASPGTGQL